MAAANYYDVVQKAYIAYYGRPADAEGLLFWANQLDSVGGNLTAIVEAFGNSAEADALFGGMTNAAMVNTIYQQLFNRDADPEGLAYYTNGLTSGRFTLSSIMLDVLNGAKGGDVEIIESKLDASNAFTDVFFTGGADKSAYAGDAVAQLAREWLAGVTDGASAIAVVKAIDATISSIVGITGPDNTFTLQEVLVSSEVVHTGPELERVVMWGYNPHAHDETSGVDNLDGNDPTGNNNNLTNEGPEDGGVPIEELYNYIQTVADLDLVQLGLINVANGEDDESTQLFGDVTGMNITQNGDGTQTISVTLSDGTVNTAEVSISQQFFDLIHGWLFDEEGNSRIYETVRAIDPNDTGSDTVVNTYAPIVLTTANNNGSTVEGSVVTTAANDLIVAGRLELLHQAYIDGGAGYNILEVDAKGTYAQPLGLYNIQEVRVENLPNVYTTAYGEGAGYLKNSTYPDLSSSGGSDDSVLDLSRATSLQRLVITEGLDTGRDLGELTVVGVRGNAVTRFEGAFSEDVNLHYGEGIDGPITVELAIGEINANLNFAHNADALNLVSTGGVVNTFDTDYLGGSLSVLNISGDAALYIIGDLDGSFQDEGPVLIDASENEGGVHLTLTDSQNVTFVGSEGNDVFQVDTNENDWWSNNSSVTIEGGAGDNRYTVDYAYTIDITNGDGNNNYEVDDAYEVNITTGDGDNFVEIDDSQSVTVVAGEGDNKIQVYTWNTEEDSYPWSALEVPNQVTVTVGDGANDIAIEADYDIGVVTVSAGDGGNVIRASAHEINVTSGTGADTIKVLADVITVTSQGADTITLAGWNNDYAGGNTMDDSGDSQSDMALVKVTAGAGSTIILGDDGQNDVNDADTFPGGTNGGYGKLYLTADQGSFITGSNLTLVVQTQADLQAATLTGITKVILDDDNGNYDDAQNSNEANGNGGMNSAVLTLTSTQFKAIGAANFSVDGSLFGTHAFIKIIVDSTTSLTDLGVANLDRNIDLFLEVQDGVTLTMTAQQLHEHVAQNGVVLPEGLDNDGNTDIASGKVVITGGGLDFDPFNTSDTISSVIDGHTYYGGSLSDDFMSGGSWYNVTVKSLVNGYDRPADDAADVVLTLDSTGTLPLTQAGFTTTMHNNLEIVGDQDITFTGDINLGENFTIDFSELEGSVTNMTIAQFQDVKQIKGNGDATVYVKLENKDNGTPTGDDTQPGVDSDAANTAGGGELANPTVASDEEGLKSSGVAKYIVTDIVDTNGSPEVGEIYLCDNTEDLEVIGLRANYQATLEVHNVAWGINFELQGGSTKKADGPTGTSNVGVLHADYEHDHADAVVTLTHSVAGDTREIKAYGIDIDNADSITIAVADATDATIDMIDGDSLNELVFSSSNDITVGGDLPAAVTSIDASDVDGMFTANLDPADDFSFVGGAGGSSLTFTDDFAASDDTSIDGGTGGVTLTIGEDQSVELDQATLTNVDQVVLEDDSELQLTIAQAADIGAANFIIADGDTASLALTNLNGTLFVVPDFDSDITISVVSIAALPEVTLNAGTDLTGIASLAVPEGTILNLTAAQFQQLTGAGTIVGVDGTTDFTVNITGLTAADIADGFDVSGITAGATLNIALAESVDLSDATLTGVDAITFGDDITLTLGDIQQADGVDIVGGANSTLKFTDTSTDPFEDIDASGFDVTTLMFLNTITSGGNRNIDDIFGGLAESILKVVYNGQGWVQEIDQVVSIEAGTTVIDSLVFNPSSDDVELQTFTINLLGGTEIDGNLRLSTGDKQDADGNDLIRTYLQTVTINSTGTAANLLSGETANVITGDITPETAIGGQDNNLLDLVINATQDFVVEGDVVFMSNVGGDGDSISANDIEDAVAVVTVNGTADVTLGGVDLTDGDVDGLSVVNNGTGTVSLTIDAADAAEDLSFTGTGDIDLTVEGAVDLSDDVLTAVDQITINDGAELTLTQAQFDALGGANLVDGETTGAATLNLVAFGSSAFDATTVDSDITIASITLVDADVTLNGNFTNVGEIVVQEGRTLTLTAAQFQQLAGDGMITGADTDGDLTAEAFNIVITGLTQADVDAGFDLSSVDVNGGTITISLGEDSVTLGELDTDGALVGGTDSVIVSSDGVQADFVLTDGQELRLVNTDQADELDVTGTGDTTLTLWFDVADFFVPGDDIYAGGYDVTTLKVLNTAVNNLDVETLLTDLASEVELRVYHDPAELGYVTSINRVVFIEEGVTVPGFMVFNDWQDDSEIRSLTLTMDGGTKIDGNLRLSTVDKDADLVALHFGTLVINSQGTAENYEEAQNGNAGVTENVIAGNITGESVGVGSTIDNTLVNVTINGTQDFVVEGDIVFTSIDADRDTATLTVNNTASVTVQQLVVATVDYDGVGGDDAQIVDTLNIVNNGGPLVVTGASPAIDADDVETINFSGTGDITLGDHDSGSSETGISSDTVSLIDASDLTGDLDLGEVEDIDSASFSFVSGSGVTKLTLTDAALDSTAVGDTGWSFDFSDAAAGSEMHLAPDWATAVYAATSTLTINMGPNGVLFIDGEAGDVIDLSQLDLDINTVQAIVLADEVELILTAAQADGLTIVAGDDTGAAGITAVVNIVDLGDEPVDLSGIAANIAGTATLEDNDVTLDATTDLGDFSVTLVELADTDTSMAGQTIRFTTVAQADGREVIVDEVIGDDDESSANVVWLFENITAPVDTADYDAAIGRLWVTADLIDNEGGDVENLFTTLPSSILRVDFSSLTELDILLASNAVDRTVELVNFTNVGDLTFSDVGATPEEHIRNLTLLLGGEVTVGDILLDDVVAAPDTDPSTVAFQDLVIESHRALSSNNVLAAEAFNNDNDGTNEVGEHVQPVNLNTVGNIGVGADNGVDLLNVYLDVGAVSVEGDTSAGAGADLDVGTITYDSEVAASTALLDITGDNDITIAAVNTADADITGLTIDATGFTGILDPVMHMDNTETLTIINTNTAAADAAATITLEEIEGNELSTIDASGYDGDLNITLSQIDSSNDDSTPLTPANDGLVEAFTFTAGAGVSTVVVQQVGANIPTLNAGSEWVFDFSGAAAGSSLTIDDTASLANGSTLSVTLAAGVALIIDGDLDLTGVTLNISGGNIQVPAGQSLTLTVDQVLALDAAGVFVEGSGTVYVTGDATDVLDTDLGAPLTTVNVNLSGVTLDLVGTPGVDADLDSMLAVVLTGGVDDNGDPAGQNVVGSANDDDITTADDLDNTLNGMAGDDTLTGGADLVDAPDNFNTYVVASGTDTIVGLKSGNDVSDVADVITASGGATVQADVASDFFATAGTTNTGATVELTAALGADQTIDVSEAGGTSGFSLTGADGTIVADNNETLIGSAQDDIINGGNWDQSAATMVDVLTGNAGDDQFVFNTSVSSAATLTVATTTTAIDREIITFVADTANDADETMTVNYTVNGIANVALIDLSGIDTTVLSEITAAAIAALDAKAGISAVSGGAGDVVIAGDNGASITITALTPGGTTEAATGLDDSSWTNGTDQDQVTTLTVGGTPTAGDLYSIIVSYNEGGGTTEDYTAMMADTSVEVADGLDDLVSEAEVVALAAASVITFTDQDGDNGGFAITTDTTAAFGGSGASDNGANDYTTADVITDFVSGSDTISFGLLAGAGNYSEAAAVADYATARADADTIFDGTVQYYLTSATDLDGAATTGLVEGQEGAGLLFVDANLDGNTDMVVLLLGVTSGSFVASDIVA